MEFSPSEVGVAGSVVVALLTKLIHDGIKRRNGKSNGMSELNGHKIDYEAHPDMRDDIKTIDGKLDKIKGTGDKILGRLDAMGSRPCQVGREDDGS